jgi:hypothetical protein
MKNSGCRLLAALCIAALAVSGCSSDDDAAPSTQPTTASTGKVKGTITLTGPVKTGTMKIGLHAQPVPAPNPKGFQKYDNAVFPLAYEVEAPVGDYWLGGFLDVENNALRPDHGDPEINPTQPVKITAGGVVTLDITFGDYASTTP